MIITVIYMIETLREAAHRANLASNSLLAYERTWRLLVAWCAALGKEPLNLSADDAETFYNDLAKGKSSSSLVQIRAALSFFYKSHRSPSPFTTLPRPRHDPDNARIEYLSVPDTCRVIGRLKDEASTSLVASLSYYLALTLYQTAARFAEMVNATWDGGRNGPIKEIHICGKGGKYASLPVPASLGEALYEWREAQDWSKSYRTLKTRHGLEYCRSNLIFAGPLGKPISNQAFNARLRRACRDVGVNIITAHGLRHSASTALLNSGKWNLRDLKELLRHKDIRTTARYTHVAVHSKKGMADHLAEILS